MKMLAALNTNTSGAAREVTINGRPHLVADAVTIVGNSVMNGILYPDSEVSANYTDLDCMLAPSSHPTDANGNPIDAYHPLAINTHNVGAFIRNPRRDGLKVVNELCVDIEVAEKSEDGIEVLRRMRAGEPVGMSTGLEMLAYNRLGEVDGRKFSMVGGSFVYNHVAVLLKEPPAGNQCYVLNSDGSKEPLHMFAVNEVTSNDLHNQLRAALAPSDPEVSFWIEDVMLESAFVIYFMGESLYKQNFYVDEGRVILGDSKEEVRQKSEYITVGNSSNTNNEEKGMELAKMVTLVIANSAKYQESDRDALMAMGEETLMAKIAGIEYATDNLEAKGFKIAQQNSSDEEDLRIFRANKAQFDAIVEEKKQKRITAVNSIVSAGNFTAEELEGHSDEFIEKLAASVGQVDYSASRQPHHANNSNIGGSADDELPISFD